MIDKLAKVVAALILAMLFGYVVFLMIWRAVLLADPFG
jgi:flagellar biosynthesis/type III secretory pathway M-ring protein FliF/YscJ